MATKFFLDTNALILLSGASESDLMNLKRLREQGKIEIQISHVQIDEQAAHVNGGFERRIQSALSRVEGLINICATKEVVFDVSRFGFATFGCKEIHKIDGKLRGEITRCMEKRGKIGYNNSRDALIGLTALNNDFFITSDDCLYDSWKKVIFSNSENRKSLELKYKIPQIIRRRKPNGIIQAIIENIS